MFVKNKSILIFLAILGLAVFLRVYKLNSIPSSLNWDEVAIGWNAYSIWETRLDEFGTRLPITFKSYGDYKAPLMIYLTTPFVGILGLENWVVRLSSVLAGIGSIFLIYLLAREIFIYLKLSKKIREKLALLSSFLLATSSWHIFFSRGAFEANMALFFVILGTLLFFYGLKRNNNPPSQPYDELRFH
jgi:4-amino-4-deoxy-L-arabinose transferase-like glycosyltransferase